MVNRLTLEVDGSNKRYNTESYSISLAQPTTDSNGRPSGETHLDNISVHITRNSEEDDSLFVDWQLKSNMQKDLAICFYDADRLIRQIKMKGAYLVGYQQSSNEPGMVDESLTFAIQELELDKANWKRRERNK
ncbi:MAG: type VI secretion system tube protein TssD [Bacteroidota bacterium]